MRYLLLLLTVQIFGQLQVHEPIKYLALGDSYTIGASVAYDERWPSQLYDSLASLRLEQEELRYIATSGWTTASLKSAILSERVDNSYNLVSLLIGVNNQYQRRPFYIYEKEFPELVNYALEAVAYDTAQFFVVSIPDYAYTPFGTGSTIVSTELDEYNQFAKDYCDSLGITYFYITDISRQGLDEPNLVAADGLHPSGKQYKLWMELIMESYVDTEEEAVTSLEVQKEEVLKIFPNPAYETISINRVGEEYLIIGVHGETLQTGISGDAIDVASLNKGIYYLKVGDAYSKFIKL
ncbi:GDSL-type esterase/lipase family protein [Cyclobacteriaceae bacterium]|nr:GDSL-type esterase/lipase family protein [Cyclobacteriaceae bacterium]